MASPQIADVSIGDDNFRAIGVHFGVSTLHDGVTGMPSVGSVVCDIIVLVDMHDTRNITFSTLKNLFELANIVNKSKMRPIKITFWADDAAQDVICTYTFQGWISSYVTSTGASRGGDQGGGNHLLTLTLQPELDAAQHTKIEIGN